MGLNKSSLVGIIPDWTFISGSWQTLVLPRCTYLFIPNDGSMWTRSLRISITPSWILSPISYTRHHWIKNEDKCKKYGRTLHLFTHMATHVFHNLHQMHKLVSWLLVSKISVQIYHIHHNVYPTTETAHGQDNGTYSVPKFSIYGWNLQPITI